jgi:hypothetical protein
MRSTLLTLVLTLLLAGAASTVAFLAGRATADAPGEYERGVTDGERLGRTAALADLEPGTDAYEKVTKPSRKRAYAAGFRDGKSEGRANGAQTARTAAFAGFDGGWEVGDWYLVNIAPRDDAQIGIGARIELRKDTWYGTCAKPSGLCRKVIKP